MMFSFTLTSFLSPATIRGIVHLFVPTNDFDQQEFALLIVLTIDLTFLLKTG